MNTTFTSRRVLSYCVLFFPIIVIAMMTLTHFAVNYPQKNNVQLVICYTLSIIFLWAIAVSIYNGRGPGDSSEWPLFMSLIVLSLVRSISDQSTGNEKEFSEMMKSLRLWNVYAYNLVHDLLALLFVVGWSKFINVLSQIKIVPPEL